MSVWPISIRFWPRPFILIVSCFSFNESINAWTATDIESGGKKAENILQMLLDFHHNGNPDIRPDARSFSHIISFYSRSSDPEAAERAELMLLGMIDMFKRGYNDCLPNLQCFASVILCYTNSQIADAGIRAERILHHLEDLHDSHGIENLTPNTYIMNLVLNAWSKSENELASERMEEILLHMEKQSIANTRSYGLVLASWRTSSSPEKARRAQQLLRLMREKSKKNKNITENTQCYKAVIKAAGATDGSLDERIKAFSVATATMQELLNSNIRLNPSSFVLFFKACSKLSIPLGLADPQIERTFDRCKRLGLVNSSVLTQLKFSASPQRYQKLLGKYSRKISDTIEINDIPSEWRRNLSPSDELD